MRTIYDASRLLAQTLKRGVAAEAGRVAAHQVASARNARLEAEVADIRVTGRASIERANAASEQLGEAGETIVQESRSAAAQTRDMAARLDVSASASESFDHRVASIAGSAFARICSPLRQAQKNDDRDAEAIAEAATQLTIRLPG